MPEYIEKEKAARILREEAAAHYPTAFHVGLYAAARAIGSIPAADVRPVITCGKCKYGKYTGTEWFCDKHSGHADKFGEDASYHEYHSKHWFCADGEERKHE